MGADHSLVASDGHVALAGDDERRAAAGGTAGRSLRPEAVRLVGGGVKPIGDVAGSLGISAHDHTIVEATRACGRPNQNQAVRQGRRDVPRHQRGRRSGPGVRDLRGSRSVGGSEIGRLWRLAITFRRPTMECVAHPAGAQPWNSPWCPSSSRTHANFIFGQSHFIKTVEDLHEALVGAVPGIRFGLAFCEASGKRLVRWSGNDEPALTLARNNALAIGAGHTFLIFLGDGFFPVNVLAAVRAVPEVCRIYCATANPTQVNRRANGAGPRRARRGGWRLAAGRRNRRGHCVAERPAAKDRLQAVVVG